MSFEIGREFMLKTRYGHMGPSPQMQGEPQPPLELAKQENAVLIDLPLPETFPEINVNLLEFIELRSSVRHYSGRPVTLPELSYLLWCTQGVKAVTPAATLRTVPSAGARHAFETYLAVSNVDGLQPGLYRFLAIDHKLVLVEAGSGIQEEIAAACFNQQFIARSAVTFIWTAVVNRMKWRYGERAYRYLHLDAGHVCQNLYLTAESIGCGTCAVAAFDDERLNDRLGIDGEEQFAVYLAAVGKKL